MQKSCHRCTCLSGKRMAASSREAYSSLLRVLAEQLGSASSTTCKHAPLMRPQGHDLPMCFASEQLLTTGEPRLLLVLLCLCHQLCKAGWPHHLVCRPGTLLGVAEPSLRTLQRHADPCYCWRYSPQGHVKEKQKPYCLNTRYPSGCSRWSSIHLCWSNNT